MDILDKKSIDITAMAMDGLSARHKALASNIANANTENYSRLDVSFEDQLKKIMQTNNAKEQHLQIKNPLESSDFKAKVIISNDPAVPGNINNVNIEMEMAELAKNGMKYNALAAIQAKAMKGLSQSIMGGGAG